MATDYDSQYPISPKGDAYSVSVAKDRIHNCKTKGLLYGGDTRPETPVHVGKKILHLNTNVSAPFATDNGPTGPASVPPRPSENRLITKKNKEYFGAEKVGSSDIDATVYSDNLAANAANSVASRSKARGQGNLINHEPSRKSTPMSDLVHPSSPYTGLQGGNHDASYDQE
ncbi:hypothetical protein CEUSTIGMA_g4271.t1 [Chlamydomonas eustigma]|uniref:Uncharacterized protein n=1 Tax=Chlamydomonas eustigma TaxID=1157962 RepID=A0A250X193_9CHLO|nr:hypothetical protein CEUSTIGMA_g4271.t1 [Chlamydomonas eustigma]|eukprot:GAX76825.1 hypothetical protein CEUSTIGMA_g4271.t1 [Chlamydomonas eustigma]